MSDKERYKNICLKQNTQNEIVTTGKQDLISWVKYNPLFNTTKYNGQNINSNVSDERSYGMVNGAICSRSINAKRRDVQMSSNRDNQYVTWNKLTFISKIRSNCEKQTELLTDSIQYNSLPEKHNTNKPNLNDTGTEESNGITKDVHCSCGLCKVNVVFDNLLKHTKVLEACNADKLDPNKKKIANICTSLVSHNVKLRNNTRYEAKLSASGRSTTASTSTDSASNKLKSDTDNNDCLNLKTEMVIQSTFVKHCGNKKYRISKYVTNYYIFNYTNKAQCRLCGSRVRFTKGRTLFLSQHLRYKHREIFGISKFPTTNHVWLAVDNNVLLCFCGNKLDLNKHRQLWRRFLSVCCNVMHCVLCSKFIICDDGSLNNAILHWKYSHCAVRNQNIRRIVKAGFKKAIEIYFKSINMFSPQNMMVIVKPLEKAKHLRRKYINKFFSHKFRTSARCKICGAICMYVDSKILFLYAHLLQHGVKPDITKYDLAFEIWKDKSKNSEKSDEDHPYIFYCKEEEYSQLINENESYLFFLNKLHLYDSKLRANATHDPTKKTEDTTKKTRKIVGKRNNNGIKYLGPLYHHVPDSSCKKAMCKLCLNVITNRNGQYDKLSDPVKCIHWDDLFLLTQGIARTALFKNYLELAFVGNNGLTVIDILRKIVDNPRSISRSIIESYVGVRSDSNKEEDGYSKPVAEIIRRLDIIDEFRVMCRYLEIKRLLLWAIFSDRNFPNAKCIFCKNDDDCTYNDNGTLDFALHVRFEHECKLFGMPFSKQDLNYVIQCEAGFKKDDVSEIILDDDINDEWRLNSGAAYDRNSNFVNLETSEELDELYSNEYTNELQRSKAENFNESTCEVPTSSETDELYSDRFPNNELSDDEEIDELYSGKFVNELPNENPVVESKITNESNFSAASPMKRRMTDYPVVTGYFGKRFCNE